LRAVDATRGAGERAAGEHRGLGLPPLRTICSWIEALSANAERANQSSKSACE
jgi:hypothetical protein